MFSAVLVGHLAGDEVGSGGDRLGGGLARRVRRGAAGVRDA